MKKYISLILMCLVLAASIYGCGNRKKEEVLGEEVNTEEVNTEEVNTEEADKASEEETEPAENEKPAGRETESEAALPEVPEEFEPNGDYDRYALVEYTVEDIEAHFIATVSAREDGSEYELHCNMDGEEQLLVLDQDLNIVSDLTGNMAYDAPLVVQKAIDADEWIKIEK